MRLAMIHAQILQKLGYQKPPNVSATLTEEDRITFTNILNGYETDETNKGRDLYEEDYFAKRYFWHLPSCA